MAVRDKDFWRANWFNEPTYTFAKMDVRKPIQGDQKVLANVGSHKCMEAMPYIEAGWRVFAFEPNPDLYDAVKSIEDKYPNFTFINKAVSAKIEGDAEFFVSTEASGMSSLVRRDPSSRSVSVQSTTLAQFCDEYDVKYIDYLLIDAELKDLEVYLSLDDATKVGSFTLEFGQNQLKNMHAAVMKKNPNLVDTVFVYRKPLDENGNEKMGVAAKCVGRYSVADYLEAFKNDQSIGKWGNVLYLDPELG